jgi:hypothetical protein
MCGEGGAVVSVQMAAGLPKNKLLVPDAGIGAEQVRKFVLVVDDPRGPPGYAPGPGTPSRLAPH